MLAAMAPEVLIPTSVDEAASLYGDGSGITIFGGGTILMPEIASGRLSPERALMLHASGLSGIERKGSVTRIGAATTIVDGLWRDGRLRRSWKDGRATADGVLE